VKTPPAYLAFLLVSWRLALSLSVGLALLTGLTLLHPDPAQAAGITVTTANEGQAGGDGCSLREAILNANNDNQSGSTECAAGNGPDIITFDNDYIITLATVLPFLEGNLTIDGSGHSVTVSGNNAVPMFQIDGSEVITLSNLSMIDGVAGSQSNCVTPCGGAIYNNFGTLTISNSTISGNSADFGGGIQNTGTLTVVNSTLSGNLATASLSSIGAGINNSFGTVLIINSTLSGNSANDFGGGIRNGSSGTLTIVNSTLSGNSARLGGGIDNGGDALTIINSTLSGNSADSGGGIHNNGDTLHLRNNIIANSPSGGDCLNLGTIATNLNNLIENGSCSPALSGDPLLSPLGSYGGSTQTFALLLGSPAIDAGDNATCAAAPVNNLDQRGIARTFGPSCDIGAFESRGFSLGSLSGTPQSTPINTAFATPLGLTVSSAFGEPVGPGGQVTLTAPGSGASVTFAPSINASTTAGGGISQPVTANGLAGSYIITATSRGAGSSANFNLTNLPFTPAVTVTSSVNPSVFGQSVTFTATISGNGSTPTGLAGFVIDGGTPISVTLTGGQASLTTSTLTAGNHTVTVNYSGDSSHTPSSGSLAGGQIVNQADTTTDLVSSANPSLSGQSVTFTATVTVVLPGIGTPTGQIDFVIDGGAPIPVTLTGGQAMLTTSTLTVGNHTVVVNYSGDSNYNSSSGSLAGGQTVGALFTYLPLLSRDFVAAPDLVIDSLTASGSEVTLVIQNTGNAPVTEAFWVDVYLDPATPPTQVNQRWPDLGSRGLVWGVQGAALPLVPGQTLALTLGDLHYRADLSNQGGSLTAGTPVYAQVDSVNALTNYGGVREGHEITGGVYNNISSVTATAGLGQALPGSLAPAPGANDRLPPRE
jgi:hypothetical protein